MDKTYAIISPTGGIAENLPSILLQDVYTPGEPTINVIYQDGCIKKGKGRTEKFTLGVSSYINMLCNFEQTTGSRYLVVGTKDKIYYYNGEEFIDITGDIEFKGEDTDYWSFTPYGDTLLFTNGVDAVCKWVGADNIAVLGGSPPKGKFITNFKNYVVLANLDTGKNRVAWSSIGEMENWTTGDSGEAIIDDVAPITGIGKTIDYLVLFKNSAIYILHYVGGSLVFNIIKRVEGLGCYAPYSICTLNNKTFFFGGDRRIYLFDGIEAHDISAQITRTLDLIKVKNFDMIYGIANETERRVYLFIPEGDVSGCNKLLIYDMELNSWYKYDCDITVAGIGGYTLENYYTWDSVKPLGLTWQTVDPDWKWRSISYTKGERINIVGSNDGKIYQLFASTQDKGDDYTGVFVTKKVPCNSPTIYKRFLMLQHYFKKEGMDRKVKVSVRVDNKLEFEQEQEFLLHSEDDEFILVNQYIDCLGKTIQVKLESSDFFQYFGTIFYYTEHGVY